MESVQAFLTAQIEPFAEDLCKDGGGKFEVARLIQKVEHFGLRIENGISLETRKDTLVGQLCYKICLRLFQSLEKSARFAKQHIRSLEDKQSVEFAQFENVEQELKAQLQKAKKELYVTTEKLNLSEKMNKLKEKEV